ncbi:cysteine desulfurase [Paenibacillus albiflavus]|uniref:cysteine desulfurase n=1 Tax=Paenibacillus albiflavus TaxID=2545760 RepID=A0A4R4EDY4_9BACL|nr:cysteine desulfurase family protein [Paenibacillus albiflavus]TCZ77270.1 cysteine desulfurase [Paenibacillus albiflavus]
MKGIYLDHAATTPIHPEVLEAMIPYLKEAYGNPSSMHTYGRETRTALNRARDLIASRIHCNPAELIFTSGGTESNNTALFSTMTAYTGEKKHMITTRAEHHAVLHPSHELEKLGFDVTYLEVDSTGLVNVQDVAAAIRPDTVLISIMYVNNEVGTLQPIEQIGQLAHEHGIVFHVDAVQALGKLPIDLSLLPVDIMSMSSHKIYGPKGTGLLYVSKHIPFFNYIHGGSQERKRRGGTENVAGIMAFAKAVELTTSEEALENWSIKAEGLRHTMIEALTKHLGSDEFVINGHPEQRVPHILNISFIGVDTETLLMNLDLEGIAAASGSACTSGSLEVSHVLQAMNLPDNVLHSAIRFSFGMGNDTNDIETAAQKVATIVKRIRK